MKHETRKIAYNIGYRDGWQDAVDAVVSLIQRTDGIEEITAEFIQRHLCQAKK